MPVPRLVADDVAVLVIDVQERLLPTIVNGEAVAHNAGVLLAVADALDLPAVATEQYPRGLGRTVEAVARHLRPDAPRVEKTRFSALVPDVESFLLTTRRQTVLVAGIEAHVCVLQTVLDLLASGRQAFVVTDAVSAGQGGQVAPALRRMERAGAVPTGVLSATYELLGDKEHPAFARCLALAKSLRA